jgi:hypothetical protein
MENADRSVFRRGSHTARPQKRVEVSESFITITHPFHPLSGRRLRVLFERKLPSGVALSCEGGPLGSLMVPLSWTDRSPAGGAVPLTYEIVVELAELVAALWARHEQ